MNAPRTAADRPRKHPARGPARIVAVRLKTPDRARLFDVAAGRGLVVSDYLRGLILDALDAAAPAAV